MSNIFPPPGREVGVDTVQERLRLTKRAAKFLGPITHEHFDDLVVSWSKRRVTLEAEAKAAEEETRAKKRAEAEAWAAEQAKHQAVNDAAKAELGISARYDDLTTTGTAKALGISTQQVRDAVSRGDLPGYRTTARWHYGEQEFWRVPVTAVAAAHGSQPPWLAAIHERKQRRAEAERQAIERTAVRLPLRSQEPSRVIVYLGPTNSGKTYRALEHLAERGSGTYAAPLRMLAMEAYERLSAAVGRDGVGLVTGEERLNETAPIICCTAEMAPKRGDLLVLDEVQWAADPERGWAWTRLLAGAEVDELYVTGEAGAAPLVRAVLGPDVEIRYCERLCPLRDGTALELGEVPARSAVVAFSRKAVLHIAGLLARKGRKVGVLYGALPPEVRREQVRRFMTGELEVLVTTDVIGHGVNLPVDTVVFAETDKFDGTERRPLAAWEIAQIGGRAGRFGMSETGTVTSLYGVPGFNPNHKLLVKVAGQRGTVDIDGVPAYRRVSKGRVAPALSDLVAPKATGLPSALKSWREAAGARLADVAWAEVAPVAPMLSRLNVLRTNGLLSKLSLDDAWRLAHSPLDADDEAAPDARVLVAVGNALTGRQGGLATMARSCATPGAAEDLERSARVLVALRWATLAFRDRLGVEHEDVVHVLDKVATALNAALGRAIDKGVARCVSCEKICAPWFSECDKCHSSRSSRRAGYRYGDDYDDYDEEDEEDDYENEHTTQRRSWDSFVQDKVRALGPEVARPLGCPREWWATVAIPLLEEVAGDERALRREMIVSWGEKAWRGGKGDVRKRLSIGGPQLSGGSAAAT